MSFSVDTDVRVTRVFLSGVTESCKTVSSDIKIFTLAAAAIVVFSPLQFRRSP